MKKFLLMSTLCALALVGCKDDSEPEIPTDIDYSGLVLKEQLIKLRNLKDLPVLIILDWC